MLFVSALFWKIENRAPNTHELFPLWDLVMNTHILQQWRGVALRLWPELSENKVIQGRTRRHRKAETINSENDVSNAGQRKCYSTQFFLSFSDFVADY